MSSVGRLCYLGNLYSVWEAIEAGEDVNDRSYAFKTGLMLAVMEKHNSIVRLLLEQPTLDLNIGFEYGRTALHFAAEHDNAEGAKLLLADPRLNTQQMNNDTMTPVMTAMRFDKVDTLRVLAAHPSVRLEIIDQRLVRFPNQLAGTMSNQKLEDWGRWELITLTDGFTKFN